MGRSHLCCACPARHRRLARVKPAAPPLPLAAPRPLIENKDKVMVAQASSAYKHALKVRGASLAVGVLTQF